MQHYFRPSTIGLSLVVILLILSQPSVTYAEANSIDYGKTVQGQITNYVGDEWSFTGCAGDVITIAMSSEEFDAYVELYPPTGRQGRIDGNSSGTTTDKLIEKYTLPTSGVYTIIAAGNRRADHGKYSLSLNLAESSTRQLGEVSIGYGKSVTSTVTTQTGDEWYFHGCAGDQITITAKSDTFDAYVELYEPNNRPSIAAGSANANNPTAMIEVQSLPTSGIYVITVAGNRRSDRGNYALSLQQGPSLELMVSATLTPTIAPTPLQTTAKIVPQCTVVADTLNLRPGPGTTYNPVISLLNRSAQLTPLSRDPNGTWIKIRLTSASVEGWVSTERKYISCNINVTELPLEISIPPIPAPTPSKSLTVANFNSCANTNNLNGAMGAAYQAPDQMKESITEENGRGCIAKLEYNIKQWAAFWMKLQHVDLTQYRTLTFAIRTDQQTVAPKRVKIELKRAGNKELSIIYVSGITTEWKTISVNLGDFGPTDYLPALSALTAMEELVFTFEAESTGSAGAVYLDDIVFQP